VLLEMSNNEEEVFTILQHIQKLSAAGLPLHQVDANHLTAG
jgi:hypothetical protein